MKIDRHAFYRIGFILIIACYSVFTLACNHQTVIRRPSTSDSICIDRPEVFSRERLLTRRIAEQRWLEAQLDNYTGTGIQGMHDVREFQKFAASLNLQFNPLAGALEAAGGQVLEDQFKHTQSLQILQYEIQAMKLRADMAALQKQIDEGAYSGSGSGAPPSSSQVTREELTQKIDALKKELESKIEEAKKQVADPGQQIRGKLGYEVQAAGEAVRADVDLHPIERLRDHRAYRSAVQAALREQELDDTHDLLGRTLNTFKFDVTVLARDVSSGMAKLTIEAIGQEPDYYRLYRQWLRSLRQDMQRRTLGIYAQAGRLTGDVRAVFIADIGRYQVQVNNRLARQAELQRQQRNKLEQDLRSLVLESEFPAAAKMSDDAKKGLKDLRSDHLFMTPPESSPTSTQDVLSASEKTLNVLKQLTDDPDTDNRDAVEDMHAELREQADKLQNTQKQLLQTQQARDNSYRLLTIIAANKTRDEKNQKILVDYAASRYASLRQFLPREGNEAEIDYVNVGTEKAPKLLPIFPDPPSSDKELENTAALKLFRQTVKDLSSSLNTAYVYTVEPAEQAQNISDVLAMEKLRSFSLAAAAMIPNTGLSLGGSLEAMRDSQQRIEAINRYPLVVGYANTYWDSNEENVRYRFGWVIGPRFAIDDKKVVFRFTPQPYTVTATLAVPAWWNKILFHTRREWVDSAGRGLTVASPSTNASNEVTAIPCDLRPDFGALTRMLLTQGGIHQDRPVLAPEVEIGDNAPIWYVQAGTARQTLRIEGEGLWRNPRVFIGSQEADQVEILPDMRGLIATFKRLQAPIGPTPNRADLVVYTSTGSAALGQAVRFVEKTDALETANKPFLKLRTPVLGLPGGPQVAAFEILKAQLPQGLYSLDLTFIGLDDENNAIDSSDVPVADPKLNLDVLQVTPPAASSEVKRYRVTGLAKLFKHGSKSFNPVTSDATLVTQFPAPEKLIHTKGDLLIKVDYDGRVHEGLELYAIVSNEKLLSLWPRFAKMLNKGNAFVEFETTRVPLERQPDGRWMVTAKAMQDRINAIVKAADTGTSKQFASLKLSLGNLAVPISGNVTVIRAAKPPAE